jgi:hypothetical protein
MAVAFNFKHLEHQAVSLEWLVTAPHCTRCGSNSLEGGAGGNSNVDTQLLRDCAPALL